MRAVTFQAPMEVRIDERPDPKLESRDDAIVAIEASGICGSDLHIYHGRVKMEPGFTIGHEFVGRVVDIGDAVTRVAVGDRVCGCFHTACGTCFYCMRGVYQKCDRVRVFGHGEALGALPGTQADLALVPMANLTLRPVPDGVSDDVALFAGDVMATAYNAIHETGLVPWSVPATTRPIPIAYRHFTGPAEPRVSFTTHTSPARRAIPTGTR